MILAEVTVSGLCCIEQAELEIPPRGLALVCGDKGSGKTSMLSRGPWVRGRGISEQGPPRVPRGTRRRTWGWSPSSQDRRSEAP
jgi:hypothetical protein